MSHLLGNPGQGKALANVGFALDENSRVRPDVFVVLAERLHRIGLNNVPVPGAPEIAIEVISPSERSSDSQRKVEAYLRFRTSEVWQVYPRSKTVLIHRCLETSNLECGSQIPTPFLPGFSLPVETIFEF